MRVLLLILLANITYAQRVTLHLTNGQFINNAPTGRDWTAYKVSEVNLYDYKDTIAFDDSELNRMTYYGKWVNATSGCFCSFSNTPNDSIVFQFTGAYGMTWIGELMRHHGIADIYLNDQYLGPIDTYSNLDLTKTRNWQRTDLDTAKVYKFKIVVTGKKNVLSTGAYIVNHGFRVINVTKPPVIPTDPQLLIIRKGRFQVYVDGIIQEGEHNEYEKALERAIGLKSKNKDKIVIVKSPDREVVIK
jgi:hypothetical protein